VLICMLACYLTWKCLPVLYLVITLPTSTPIWPAPCRRPARTRAMRGSQNTIQPIR